MSLKENFLLLLSRIDYKKLSNSLTSPLTSIVRQKIRLDDGGSVCLEAENLSKKVVCWLQRWWLVVVVAGLLHDIDGYYRRKLEKEMKKGLKKAGISEHTVFNDEEQRRIEMQELRERQKEEEVLALKRSIEGGMAQALKEQSRLKEEMVYLYKIGDIEGAAAIQRRLDPDVPM